MTFTLLPLIRMKAYTKRWDAIIHLPKEHQQRRYHCSYGRLDSPVLYSMHHLYVGDIFYCCNSGFFCQNFNFELLDFVLSNMNSLLGDWDTAKFWFRQNDIMSKPMWMDYSCIAY